MSLLTEEEVRPPFWPWQCYGKKAPVLGDGLSLGVGLVMGGGGWRANLHWAMGMIGQSRQAWALAGGTACRGIGTAVIASAQATASWSGSCVTVFELGSATSPPAFRLNANEQPNATFHSTRVWCCWSCGGCWATCPWCPFLIFLFLACDSLSSGSDVAVGAARLFVWQAALAKPVALVAPEHCLPSDKLDNNLHSQ